AVERIEVARDGSLHLLDAFFNFGPREILVPVVDGFELAAVNAGDGLSEKLQPAAEDDELRADRPDRGAIVFAEIGDGFEIRHQPARQPYQFHIALGFAFEAAAR